MDNNNEIGLCGECASFVCKCGSRVGDNLESRIPSFFKTKGCGCENTKQELNRMTVSQCEAQFDRFVGVIVERAKKFMIPRLVSSPYVSKILWESIDQAKEAEARMEKQMKGITGEVRSRRSMSSMFREML